MNIYKTNTCLYCKKPISGRADKKYCDAYCRNSQNNKRKSTDELMMRESNQILRKNRRILKDLSPEGKAMIRKDILLNLGFKFGQFTSMFISSGSVYYICYDYGYRVLINNGKQKIQIIQKQDYMPDFDPWKYIKSTS